MDKRIQEALDTPADYSQDFTRKVAVICARVSKDLGFSLHQDDDMNYSSSQRLFVFMDKSSNVCSKESPKSTYELVFLLSSKACFFTALCLRKVKDRASGTEHWEIVRHAVASEVEEMMESIAQKVEEHSGHVQLKGDLLNQKVEGKFTEMDGAAATVFEVLFSELY